MPKFNRIAEVEFAVGNTQTRIKVSNLPYVWDSDECYDMDQPAVFAASYYLWSKGFDWGLNLVMVSTSRERPQMEKSDV